MTVHLYLREENQTHRYYLAICMVCVSLCIRSMYMYKNIAKSIYV